MSRTIETEELISSFIEVAKTQFPDVDPSDLEKVVRAQFLLVKETMQEGNLEEIRLQYLFTLRVSPQRVVKHLRVMNEYKYKIREEKYKYFLEKLLNYIKQQPKKFKKYEHRITKYTGYTIREIEQEKHLNTGH